MDQSDIADDVIATAEPLEISPPSKFARRFIAARWVNVCSQCERPLPGHRWGNKKYNRRYGLAKFFCPGGYCQARYFGRVSNGEAEPTENVPSVPETPVLTTSIAFCPDPIAICPGWQVAYDRLQWVLQHWRAPRWRDRAFCRTRSGLEQSIRELIGQEHQAAVAHLPDWHPDAAGAPEPNRSRRVETPLEVVSSPETAVDRASIAYQHGPTPGALQGDDVQLEYYSDGFPKLPACPDRLRNFKKGVK